MNTSSTKTRALCVATRCTSVEQFVATFHRFCGDDQTFFVATMTSRPIGLETPFSIQLADRQPVLRGLCIVLDAWQTPENRYRRPGIRLGIKRLTADSQVIFDRLQAAARSPSSVAEAPPPGPAPKQLAAGSRPPGAMRRSATPPPLPPLLPPRPTPPAVPAISRDGAPPLAVVRVPPLGAGAPTTAPRLGREARNGGLPPRGVAEKPALPSGVPVEARSAPPSVPPVADAKPALPSVLPVEAKPALPSVVPVEAKPALPSVAPVEGRSAPPSVPPVADAKPALPSVKPSLETKPALPSVVPVEAKAALPSVPPVAEAKPALPSVPPLAEAKPAPPSVVPVEAKPGLPSARPSPEAKAALPSVVPVEAKPAPGAPTAADGKPASTAPAPAAPPSGSGAPAAEPPAPAARAPIAVTRFQVALRVDTTPPPLTGVEFKPTELVPRQRIEPRMFGAASPSEAQFDDALPAVIIDRMSGPVSAEPDDAGDSGELADAGDSADSVPSFAPHAPTNPTVDPLADRRTPGSALILPANPLQDLSDESIEGFVDCTLYEETENIFHPGVDGAEWADVTAEQLMPPFAFAPPAPPEPVAPPEPAAPPAPRITPPRLTPPRISPPSIAVPALPSDAPPDPTVRAHDGTESLAVAAGDPAPSRALAGGLAAAAGSASNPSQARTPSGPLGVPSAVIVDDPPPNPAPSPPPRRAGDEAAVIIDDPALSRVVSGELGGTRSSPASDDPAQSRTASGELWSETLRRTPAAGLPRTQARAATPLPRPATDVPMDLGQGPDPASWFDSVSLPGAGGPAPRPAMAMDSALAPEPAPEQAAGLTSGMPEPAMNPALAAAMPPGHRFTPVPMDPAHAAAMAPAFASSLDPSLMGMPPDPSLAQAPSGYGYGAPGFGQLEPGPPGYPPVDSAPYPRYSAAELMSLPGQPSAGAQPPWLRWLLIAGSAIIAIALAFVIARMVRGRDRAPPAAGAASTTGPPARAPAPPRAAPAAAAPPPPAVATAAAASRDPRRAAIPTRAEPANPASPGGDPAIAPATAPAIAGDTDPSAGAADAPPDDEGDAVAGGTPVVGSGPCRFTVATTPAGAVVRFDEQPMGPSPITIQGSCDKHKVDVAHARYQAVTKWVTLAADKQPELDISLPRPVHAVTVTSFPPGAELSIDGHRAGTTPTVVQMIGFATVNLTFTKPGFQTVTRRVYSKVPQDRVFVKLMK